MCCILPVSGRFLFLRMVGGRCLDQYMAGGRWSVASRWAVVLYYAGQLPPRLILRYSKDICFIFPIDILKFKV